MKSAQHPTILDKKKLTQIESLDRRIAGLDIFIEHLEIKDPESPEITKKTAKRTLLERQLGDLLDPEAKTRRQIESLERRITKLQNEIPTLENKGDDQALKDAARELHNAQRALKKLTLPAADNSTSPDQPRTTISAPTVDSPKQKNGPKEVPPETLKKWAARSQRLHEECAKDCGPNAEPEGTSELTSKAIDQLEQRFGKPKQRELKHGVTNTATQDKKRPSAEELLEKIIAQRAAQREAAAMAEGPQAYQEWLAQQQIADPASTLHGRAR